MFLKDSHIFSRAKVNLKMLPVTERQQWKEWRRNKGLSFDDMHLNHQRDEMSKVKNQEVNRKKVFSQF